MKWSKLNKKTLSSGTMLGAPYMQRFGNALDDARDAFGVEHVIGSAVSAGGAHDSPLITRGWASYSYDNPNMREDLAYGIIDSIAHPGVGQYTITLSETMREPYIAWVGARKTDTEAANTNGLVCVCNPASSTTVSVRLGQVSGVNSMIAIDAAFFIEIKGDMEGNEVALGTQYFQETGQDDLVSLKDVVSREDIAGVKDSLISAKNTFSSRHDTNGEHYDALITRGWVAAYFDPLTSDYNFVTEGAITGASRNAEGVVYLTIAAGTFANTSYLIAHTPMAGVLQIASPVGSLHGPWGGHFTVAKNASVTQAEIYIARPDGAGSYEVADGSFYAEVKGF